MERFEERMRDGYLYGDYQFATDATRDSDRRWRDDARLRTTTESVNDADSLTPPTAIDRRPCLSSS